ncbi:MAG: ATP-binding cassette domain-containing protein [Gammaproteobacteria bacterium]
MLTLRQLSLQRGGKPLFDDVSLTLFRGQKVGVVGANGVGKSSLFSLILGEIHADTGDLELPPSVTIAHVAQETPALEIPAIDHVLAGDARWVEVTTALATAEAAQDGERIAIWHARLEEIDGYSARARSAQLMAGLGFGADQVGRPIAEFSGGWRVRLNLARALNSHADLLLLDEPTNHLDLDAVIWLEQWLRNYPGTLLLISHDRDFLDSITDHIANIEHCRIRLYSGNYSDFELQRSAQLSLQQAAYAKQQREIAHLSRFIERFRAKATKARQAQSRLKALERMEKIAPAHFDSPFRFQLREPDKLPTPLLGLERADAGYGDRTVLQNVTLTLTPGTRLGLLGANGAGKSTLVKMLAQALPLQAGVRHEGQGLAIGYFAQHQLEQLRTDWSALQHLQHKDSGANEQVLRDYLGGFGFAGDRALTLVAPFSGGEKARLALALIVWRRPNLLLLDEPTNHLDLDMRHALTLALQDFQGALVLVSHDRHLLRTTTDSFVLVDSGRIQAYTGDLDDYKNWLIERQRARNDESANPARPASETSRRLAKRAEAERRNQLYAQRRPLEQRSKTIEHDLGKLIAERQTLQTALVDPEIYQEVNKTRLKELLLRQAQVDKTTTSLEEQWLECQEALAALEITP